MKKLFYVFFFVILMGIFIYSSNQEFDWVKIEPLVSPTPGRQGHQIIYDQQREVIVLFGGQSGNDLELNDSWEYIIENGMKTWKKIVTPNKPRTRAFFGIAYDAQQKVTLIFGGEDWPYSLNDTWKYDGTDWSRITTLASPQPTRAHLNIAYDSQQNKTYLFGGWHWYTTLGDMWQYDGADWSPVIIPQVPNAPARRQNCLMVYDEKRNVLVLFGGSIHNQGVLYDDTWEWDCSQRMWTEISCVNHPCARENPHGTYDSENGKVILFGGRNTVTGLLNDTWQYGQKGWSKLDTAHSPEKRAFTSIAYHKKERKTVLFGGSLRNDTWELILKNQPPIAICKNIEVAANENCQAFVSSEDIDNGSYDPDQNDNVSLTLDNTGPFSIGSHNVTLTVTDTHEEYDTCTAMITVKDERPPVPNDPELQILTGECSVNISDFPTATDNCAGEITGKTNDPLNYSEQGMYLVSWIYDDGNGNSNTQKQTIVVKDTTPPIINEIMANPSIIRTVNHKMIPVTLTALVTDNCDSNPRTKIISVISNEQADGKGDGHTEPDWEITGDLTLNLRAERSGKGSGRIYTITVISTDSVGNNSTANVTVTVPHDKRYTFSK